jgi:hypothetical protein
MTFAAWGLNVSCGCDTSRKIAGALCVPGEVYPRFLGVRPGV